MPLRCGRAMAHKMYLVGVWVLPLQHGRAMLQSIEGVVWAVSLQCGRAVLHDAKGVGLGYTSVVVR